MQELPRVYVTRKLPQVALDRLGRHTRLTVWPGELPPPRAVLRREVAEVEGLITLVSDRVDAALLARAPHLRVVSNYAVGYDNIDLEACTARGVLVTNTPQALEETTADFTLALILAAARRIPEAERYVHAGHWRTWGPELLLGRELAGCTLGLVGLGRIGRAVARRARGFGVRMLYHTPVSRPQAEEELGVAYASMAQLLAESDIISLHCPLTDDTYHLIDRDALAAMKPDVILVNTARGPVVDTQALVAALGERPMVAALDVTDPEPLPRDHPLLKLPNAIVTPHIGSATVAARTRMAMIAVNNLLAALRGEHPPALVNPEAWQA